MTSNAIPSSGHTSVRGGESPRTSIASPARTVSEDLRGRPPLDTPPAEVHRCASARVTPHARATKTSSRRPVAVDETTNRLGFPAATGLIVFGSTARASPPRSAATWRLPDLRLDVALGFDQDVD